MSETTTGEPRPGTEDKIVLMQFGDGSFKRINMGDEYETDEDAVAAAREWVEDNAWFEIEEGS